MKTRKKTNQTHTTNTTYTSSSSSLPDLKKKKWNIQSTIHKNFVLQPQNVPEKRSRETLKKIKKKSTQMRAELPNGEGGGLGAVRRGK